MTRKSERELAEQIESDALKSDAWLEDTAPVQKQTLGTQVTIRLAPTVANRLRLLAGRYGVGYSALLRAWIEDRIRTELERSEPTIVAPQRFDAGITVSRSANDFDVEDSGRRLKDLVVA